MAKRKRKKSEGKSPRGRKPLKKRRTNKPGPASFKERACLPAYASIDCQIQAGVNENKKNTTLSIYREGVRLMWEAAPEAMKTARIKPMGKYDKLNHHGGRIWGWPNECNMTDTKAKTILLKCIKSGKLTIDELKCVRKSLSYAYELVHHESGLNWPCIPRVWKSINLELLHGQKKHLMPTVIPSPKQLKRAFTKQWTRNHSMSLLKKCCGTVAAYDSLICGGRPGRYGDIARIKMSRTHGCDLKRGFMWTQMKGGRCKLQPGTEMREWKLYRVCLCPGGKHVSPPKGFYKTLDRQGNPRGAVNWHTCCPIACVQLKWQWKEARNYVYSKCSKSGRCGKQQDKDVMALATDWMVAQGQCPANKRYCHNSGRKALGSWLSKLQVEFEEGFEIHQDHPDTWRRKYQRDLGPTDFTRRTQSEDPKIACAALRTLSTWFGVGVKRKPELKRVERFMYHILKNQDKKLANKIKHGQPTDSSSDEDEEVVKGEVKEEEVN